MDRFDAMQAFARVVETGSFTKAADTLHMSKTSVTQLVQQLEARLRVRLLNRTTRKVNVTADGAAYYERVIRLLADMDDAETSLSAAASAPRGRLRVDVPSPFASLILIPALPAFRERYPEIQLDLGVSDRHVDLIDDNVDCVVRGGAIAEQSLVARHVGDLRIGVYAAPGYLARAGVPDTRANWAITRSSASSARAPARRFPVSCAAARSVSPCRAVWRWQWTTAMPTSPPAWPALASSGSRNTWPRPSGRAERCYRCSRTGNWSRCRSTWPTHPTGMSAPSCGCLSIGWRS